MTTKLEPIADYRKRLERWKTKHKICVVENGGISDSRKWLAFKVGKNLDFYSDTEINAARLAARFFCIPLPPKRKAIKS